MSHHNSDYIRVDSIEEIDPNKLSVSYVGKKFIDKNNNRFSIRFNKLTRKMEVVKILIKSNGRIQEDTGLKSWEHVHELEKNILDYSRTKKEPITETKIPSAKERLEEIKRMISRSRSEKGDSSANTYGGKDWGDSASGAYGSSENQGSGLNSGETSPRNYSGPSTSYPSGSLKDSSLKSGWDKVEKGYPKSNLDPKREGSEASWSFDSIDLDISDEKDVSKSAKENSSSNTQGSDQKNSGTDMESFMDETIDPESETKTTSQSVDSAIPGGSKATPKGWDPKLESEKIEELYKSIEVAKTRINSALINIKSSRIFEITGDPSENQNIIGNLTREFDIEVFQPLDKLSNYYKELTSYPRAINYYTSKFERTKKDELTKAESEKDKLKLVIRWEMQDGFTGVLAKMKALTLSLLNVLNMKTEGQIKQLQYTNQLMFVDAKNATVFCSQDIERMIQEVSDWKFRTK
jgi:hypothetical protein